MVIKRITFRLRKLRTQMRNDKLNVNKTGTTWERGRTNYGVPLGANSEEGIISLQLFHTHMMN